MAWSGPSTTGFPSGGTWTAPVDHALRRASSPGRRAHRRGPVPGRRRPTRSLARSHRRTRRPPGGPGPRGRTSRGGGRAAPAAPGGRPRTGGPGPATRWPAPRRRPGRPSPARRPAASGPGPVHDKVSVDAAAEDRRGDQAARPRPGRPGSPARHGPTRQPLAGGHRDHPCPAATSRPSRVTRAPGPTTATWSRWRRSAGRARAVTSSAAAVGPLPTRRLASRWATGSAGPGPGHPQVGDARRPRSWTRVRGPGSSTEQRQGRPPGPGATPGRSRRVGAPAGATVDRREPDGSPGPEQGERGRGRVEQAHGRSGPPAAIRPGWPGGRRRRSRRPGRPTRPAPPARGWPARPTAARGAGRPSGRRSRARSRAPPPQGRPGEQAAPPRPGSSRRRPGHLLEVGPVEGGGHAPRWPARARTGRRPGPRAAEAAHQVVRVDAAPGIDHEQHRAQPRRPRRRPPGQAGGRPAPAEPAPAARPGAAGGLDQHGGPPRPAHRGRGGGRSLTPRDRAGAASPTPASSRARRTATAEPRAPGVSPWRHNVSHVAARARSRRGRSTTWSTAKETARRAASAGSVSTAPGLAPGGQGAVGQVAAVAEGLGHHRHPERSGDVEGRRARPAAPRPGRRRGRARRSATAGGAVPRRSPPGGRGRRGA